MEELKEFLSRIGGKTLGSHTTIVLKGRAGAFVSLLVSFLRGKTVVFFEEEDEATLLREEIEFFRGEAPLVFPPRSQRIFQRGDEAKRMAFLVKLALEEEFLGLFPYEALDLPLPRKDSVLSRTMKVSFGDRVPREELISYLEAGGYELVSLVREKGQYAKRGAIVDFFPPTEQRPIRIEFLGDEVLSIRSFDERSQRSEKEMERVLLTPFTEAEVGGNLFDYLGWQTTFVFSSKEAILKHLGRKGEEIWASGLRIDTSGISEGPSLELMVSSNEDLRHIFATNRSEVFSRLVGKIGEWKDLPYLYLFVYTGSQADRIREILRTYGISLPVLQRLSFLENEREWGIVVGPLKRGFRTERAVFLTEEDVFGPKKRVARLKGGEVDYFLESFRDLKTGDYVVHVDHGIGLYKGMVELSVNGSRKDFLLIEYEGGDKLYVPVHDLELVQKYIGAKEARPKLDRLGSPSWSRTKRKVKGKIEEFAKDLLRIQAEREICDGYAYPEEDELFREMESKFEYEETEGQLRAIREVLDDLKRKRPMDRLVCGDVGFGKTEVAIRAAFKVAMEGKQVAVLVPTTVLAQQHLKVFGERLKDYPLVIEMLSRFVPRDRQKEIVERLRKGAIDIIIGTHRLLQRDVIFKDLGLLVVDEEQRFGVKDKERLKEVKKTVDVLTLTATPIPRTLSLALSGIKDLSIIDTPPLDRLAIRTYVVRFNEEVIRKGILEELRRGGQVFFVHNYIHNIQVVYNYLKSLIPSLKIALAHGRMRENELESIMVDFVEGKYDLLLSTNIVESGLDISNVNTIFINNAHKFGLADLYQLRGRVGRGPRQAYAYLLVPEGEKLTEEAKTRLRIIEELQELGSGIHIANYDLELRGAGNILGREQSGNIELVGFELYTRLLEQTIRELKAEKREEETLSPEIVIPIDAYIPESYVDDATQKLLLYKRLSKVGSYEELEEMEREMEDRFGALPAPTRNLLTIISLKVFLLRLGIRRIEYSPGFITITVTDRTPLRMDRLLSLAKKDGRVIKLLPENKIVVRFQGGPFEAIEVAKNVLKDITLCDINFSR